MDYNGVTEEWFDEWLEAPLPEQRPLTRRNILTVGPQDYKHIARTLYGGMPEYILSHNDRKILRDLAWLKARDAFRLRVGKTGRIKKCPRTDKLLQAQMDGLVVFE